MKEKITAIVKKAVWIVGLISAILGAIVSYTSCSVLAVTAGKSKSSITTSTTTTTIIDSTKLVTNLN